MKVTTDACLFGAWIAKDAADSGRKIEKALDIGAGTGLLTLMFAQKNNGTYIHAVELEKDAATQAGENFKASHWKDRTSLVHTNIKTFAPDHKFDVIISNPPFYENELESPDTSKKIAHHRGGLSLNELFAAIASHLEPGGVFYILLPYKRNNEIESLLKKNSLHLHQKVLVSQSTKHDHFRTMLKGSNVESAGIKSSELSICDDKQQYTTGFIELLKDYYLKL